MKFQLTSLLVTATLFASSAYAATPVQVSVPGINLPAGDVSGVRLSALYGRSHNVKGLNISLLGLSDIDNFTGINLGMFYGANRTRNSMKGVEFGLANLNEGTAKGADFGLINYTANNFTGGQFGLFNYAGSLNGLQFGFMNATDHINKGIQIGLINYDRSGTFVSKDLPVFPIVNARF